MHFSFYTVRAGLNPAVGFGYASQNIISSLQKMGHKVTFANPKAEVQINFTQPHQFKLHKNQYQIGYTPWESTGMRSDWTEIFNLCDEVWATSTWVGNVFKDNGVVKPISIYPHGIEDIWTPKRRILKDNQVLKFLHVGEPAPRKSGQLVVDTFIKMFGNNPKYQLTIKAHNSHTLRVYNKKAELVSPDKVYSNIKIITEEYPINLLVNLFHSHHILLYPTWGEGFGFIPLQALATGMPTICTYNWAEYEKFLGPLKLKSKLTGDTLPKAVGDPHVGNMFKPDEDHLIEQMLFAVENYNALSGYYYTQSTKIHEEYNWDRLTKKAFDPIIKKFS